MLPLKEIISDEEIALMLYSSDTNVGWELEDEQTKKWYLERAYQMNMFFKAQQAADRRDWAQFILGIIDVQFDHSVFHYFQGKIEKADYATLQEWGK
jgi:hypothetical protein